MPSLFDTGIIPAINAHLVAESEKRRDYGDYWSASSAGYCNRKNIFDRLGVPHTLEDPRKQRVFSSGHIFHDWIQAITKESGLSIAQELELQDEDLMIRGHIDDLVLMKNVKIEYHPPDNKLHGGGLLSDYLILYDYKTAHSKWFEYAKGRPMSYYHKYQLGTYMYMLRKADTALLHNGGHKFISQLGGLTEARILKISKDDLRLYEQQLLWSDELETEIKDYWEKLNYDWSLYNLTNKLPPCTCADHENGFLAKPQYNPYFYEGESCSTKWFENWKEENAAAKV